MLRFLKLVLALIVILLPFVGHAGDLYSVSAATVDVFAEAGGSAGRAARLSKGDLLTLLEIRGDWLRVELQNGKVGWVREEGLRLELKDTPEGAIQPVIPPSWPRDGAKTAQAKTGPEPSSPEKAGGAPVVPPTLKPRPKAARKVVKPTPPAPPAFRTPRWWDWGGTKIPSVADARRQVVETVVSLEPLRLDDPEAGKIGEEGLLWVDEQVRTVEAPSRESHLGVRDAFERGRARYRRAVARSARADRRLAESRRVSRLRETEQRQWSVRLLGLETAAASAREEASLLCAARERCYAVVGLAPGDGAEARAGARKRALHAAKVAAVAAQEAALQPLPALASAQAVPRGVRVWEVAAPFVGTRNADGRRETVYASAVCTLSTGGGDVGAEGKGTGYVVSGTDPTSLPAPAPGLPGAQTVPTSGVARRALAEGWASALRLVGEREAFVTALVHEQEALLGRAEGESPDRWGEMCLAASRESSDLAAELADLRRTLETAPPSESAGVSAADLEKRRDALRTELLEVKRELQRAYGALRRQAVTRSVVASGAGRTRIASGQALPAALRVAAAQAFDHAVDHGRAIVESVLEGLVDPRIFRHGPEERAGVDSDGSVERYGVVAVGRSDTEVVVRVVVQLRSEVPAAAFLPMAWEDEDRTRRFARRIRGEDGSLQYLVVDDLGWQVPVAGKPKLQSWRDAAAEAERARQARLYGLDSWRLPRVDELDTLQSSSPQTCGVLDELAIACGQFYWTGELESRSGLGNYYRIVKFGPTPIETDALATHAAAFTLLVADVPGAP